MRFVLHIAVPEVIPNISEILGISEVELQRQYRSAIKSGHLCVLSINGTRDQYDALRRLEFHK